MHENGGRHEPDRDLVAISRQMAKRALMIMENRMQLLTVELHEERSRFFRAVLVTLMVSGCYLLAAIALTAAIVVAFWNISPLAALLMLSVIYGVTGFLTWKRMIDRMRSWDPFPSSLEQLRRDREILDRISE